MQPDAVRLIDLTTRPMEGNAELNLVARAELRKALEVHGEDDPAAMASVVAAANALADADRHFRRKWWAVVLYVATLLISLPLVFDTGRQLLRSSQLITLLSPMSTGTGTTKLAPIRNLSPQQTLLLYGDETSTSTSNQWKALWKTQPENPIYLAKYARAYFEDHKELSAEILQTAERIDPDNGWFQAFVAAATVDGVVTRSKLSTQDKLDGKAPAMTIHNEDKLNETLAILHQIASKPRFTSYQSQLFAQQLRLLPPRRDYLTQIPLLVHTSSLISSNIQFRRFFDAFAAGAQQCAATGNIEGFRQISADWRAYVTASIKDGDTLVDLLIAKVMLFGSAANFRDAAQTLGLEEEAQYFSGLDQGYREMKKRSDLRMKSDEAQIPLEKCSVLSGMFLPMVGRQVQSPPTVTDLDLRPARYVDHALAGRIGAMAGCILLGVVAGLAFVAVALGSPLSQALGKRLCNLLSPWDWAKIVIGGVVFPIIWYAVITRLTPISAREWTITHISAIPASGQYTCLVLSLIVMPWVVASGYLAKRGAALGLKPRFPRMGRVAATAALTGVAAFGAIPFVKWLLVPAFLLASLTVISILTGLALNFFGQKSQVMRRATLSRLAIPMWVAGSFAFALLIPLHHAEERYWTRLDRLGEITTDTAPMIRYEYEITNILRYELSQVITPSHQKK